ncbi:MAG: undecaprenyldiphospho-muramoylpentapeptide beta-N-acetylglucosaminyltransferase, partial [Proteobacteria bacterium]|jgi:UDP-N-acetylglucosamine--N-acetylmuramyl-(pentapeptide) pyrophosphoryl-undecaprenol N-acetylglucosamine transferase|nr:undecaprenyldiphospho-muramoylpentapeptide beta-N-acetylglucosaminyltransferase [Pseudomonadota bacterium]
LKVVIAGGGTAGHINPGLAVAKALQSLNTEVEVHFVGTAQGLETKIVPREGFPLHLLAGGKLNLSGRFLEKLKTLISLPWGFLQATALNLKLQPDFVLGVGGYASGPFVLASRLLGSRTAIWEPNAHPGKANIWLSCFVNQAFLVFEESRHYLKSKKYSVCGMPIRPEVEEQRHLRTDHPDFQILHYGGSQGARFVGTTLSQAVINGGKWLENTRVIHQTGPHDFETFKAKYQKVTSSVEVRDFIFDMSEIYKQTDLAIVRGGASTLAEVAAFGLPTIVIPLPIADGHQVQNAKVLASAGAAVMIPQSELTPEKLAQEITRLKEDSVLRENLSQRISQFFQPKAAQKIAQEILDAIAKI